MTVVQEDLSEQEKVKLTENSEILAEPFVNVESVPEPRISVPSRGWLAGKRRLFIGVGICVAIAVGGKYLISNFGRPNAKNQLTPSQMARKINATGTVVAKELLTILPQVEHLQIKQVLVKEGDKVKTGQVMAVFDDSVLRSQTDQARGQMESSRGLARQKQAALGQAQAELAKVKANLGQAQAELAKVKANLGQAQAELAKAINENKRYQFLATQGAISFQNLESRSTDVVIFQEQVRSSQAEIARAQAEIASAQAEVASAQAGIARAQAEIASAQADVRSSEARIKQFQTQREHTLLRAPASGLVTERTAHVGHVTSFDRKLFSLARDSSFQLQVKLEEYQLPGIRIGAPVRVTSDTDKRIQLRGIVREISPIVDPQTHQPIVTISLPSSSLLLSGMVLQVAIVSTTGTAQELKGAPSW